MKTIQYSFEPSHGLSAMSSTARYKVSNDLGLKSLPNSDIKVKHIGTKFGCDSGWHTNNIYYIDQNNAVVKINYAGDVLATNQFTGPIALSVIQSSYSVGQDDGQSELGVWIIDKTGDADTTLIKADPSLAIVYSNELFKDISIVSSDVNGGCFAFSAQSMKVIKYDDQANPLAAKSFTNRVRDLISNKRSKFFALDDLGFVYGYSYHKDSNGFSQYLKINTNEIVPIGSPASCIEYDNLHDILYVAGGNGEGRSWIIRYDVRLSKYDLKSNIEMELPYSIKSVQSSSSSTIFILSKDDYIGDVGSSSSDSSQSRSSNIELMTSTPSLWHTTRNEGTYDLIAGTWNNIGSLTLSQNNLSLLAPSQYSFNTNNKVGPWPAMQIDTTVFGALCYYNDGGLFTVSDGITKIAVINNKRYTQIMGPNFNAIFGGYGIAYDLGKNLLFLDHTSDNEAIIYHRTLALVGIDIMFVNREVGRISYDQDYILLLEESASDIKLYVNGELSGTASVGLSAPYMSFMQDAGFSAGVPVSEIMIFDHLLQPSDKTNIMRYLSMEYDISVGV